MNVRLNNLNVMYRVTMLCENTIIEKISDLKKNLRKRIKKINKTIKKFKLKTFHLKSKPTPNNKKFMYNLNDAIKKLKLKRLALNTKFKSRVDITLQKILRIHADRQIIIYICEKYMSRRLG